MERVLRNIDKHEEEKCKPSPYCICKDVGTNNKASIASFSYYVSRAHVQSKGEGFFEPCRVVAVTVALKNGKLLKLMGKRKAQIRYMNMCGWTNNQDDDFIVKPMRKVWC